MIQRCSPRYRLTQEIQYHIKCGLVLNKSLYLFDIKMRHGGRPVMLYTSGPVPTFAERSLHVVCSNLPVIVTLIGGVFKQCLERLLLSRRKATWFCIEKLQCPRTRQTMLTTRPRFWEPPLHASRRRRKCVLTQISANKFFFLSKQSGGIKKKTKTGFWHGGCSGDDAISLCTQTLYRVVLC